MPRALGKPDGDPLDEMAGGLPCKHMVWAELEAMEKDATIFADSISNEMYEVSLGDMLGVDNVGR